MCLLVRGILRCHCLAFLSIPLSLTFHNPIIIFIISVTIPAPSAPPSGVEKIITTRQLIFTWTAPECIEQNGIITGYAVDFGVFLGVENQSIIKNVETRMFIASDLTPGVTYGFKVAAKTTAGVGPFTGSLLTFTPEARMS